ncbi:restriction endonuclease subunit S [Flavobacterium sandaracinum]|uniref:Restriction endonuclease subunit S n=1 Tax=Flavobacterium sandaracinum TaxID=2541733 RepID=A0A4R5D8X6_9FLAO|nr:restriction endonuclease subunit S [Flavobacterium sandaracinum]TDE07834.1 restriction endonuclease subunit S [Flavobacterium sandaracinum]
MNTTQHKTNYKNSPLGLIPEDWEVKTLGEVITIKGDYGINAAAVDFDEQLPIYIRITDIDDEGNFSSEKKKSVNDVNSSNFYLNKNDLVFVRTGATVGKSYLYNENDGKLVFAGFLIRFRVDTSKANDYFLWSFTKSKPYWDWVTSVSMRSGQPGINSSEYSSLKLPIPPLPEQNAIANCLSTWDKAIATQTQLIAQKELNKKAVMQQLLSGKKRLKGYSVEWKEMRLRDVFERVTSKNVEVNTNVVTISAQRGFIRQGDYFNKIVASDVLDNYFLVQKGDFCYNKSYSNGYPWGATKRLTDFDKAVVTTLYICFRIKSEASNSGEFFEQFFEVNSLDKGLTKIAHEGGRAHGLLNVTPNDFFGLKIKVPEYKEQTTIANILQCADEEIQLLKNKLQQLKDQKKGLMQVLFTGKKRLEF